MVSAEEVTGVLVTRGDVDLQPVLDTLPFTDVVVWNNRTRPQDLQCYGRFQAVTEARHDLIYFQDDDLLVPIQGLLDEYDPASDRGRVVANVPPGEEWRFLGCGSIFHRALIDFSPYLDRYPLDDDFLRACDVVFAYGHPYRRVWVGYEDLPWQTAANRMYKQPGHYKVREKLRDRQLAIGGDVGNSEV